MWAELGVLNIFMCSMMIEFYFKKCKAHFEDNEERDRKMPAFRRLDVQNWTRLRLYPNIIVFFFPRLILWTLSMIAYIAMLRIVQIGASKKNGLSDSRQWIVQHIIANVVHYMYAFSAGVYNTFEHLDGSGCSELFDYSYYLGPSWKKELEARTARTGLIVCNHIHFSDPFVIVGYVPHSTYLAKKGAKNIPVFGSILTTLDALFVERSDDKSRDMVAEALIQRQK